MPRGFARMFELCILRSARGAEVPRMARGAGLGKGVGNFCEYFDFARRKWTAKNGTNKRENAAREQLKKLLGD